MFEWIKSAVLGAGMFLGGGPEDQQPEHPEKPPTEQRYAASELRRRDVELVEEGAQQLEGSHGAYVSEGGEEVDPSGALDRAKKLAN